MRHSSEKNGNSFRESCRRESSGHLVVAASRAMLFRVGEFVRLEQEAVRDAPPADVVR